MTKKNASKFPCQICLVLLLKLTLFDIINNSARERGAMPRRGGGTPRKLG